MLWSSRTFSSTFKCWTESWKFTVLDGPLLLLTFGRCCIGRTSIYKHCHVEALWLTWDFLWTFWFKPVREPREVGRLRRPTSSTKTGLNRRSSIHCQKVCKISSKWLRKRPNVRQVSPKNPNERQVAPKRFQNDLNERLGSAKWSPKAPKWAPSGTPGLPKRFNLVSEIYKT